MYAIVEFKGFQYKAEKDKIMKVPYCEELEAGATIEIPRVLLLADGDNISVGQPTVSSAMVKAEVLAHGKEKKIIIFKKKRRKGYEKKQGHRQDFTRIRITDITK